MVSNASDDFPDPQTPVTTISFPVGSVRSMFYRWLVRAPRMVMYPFRRAGVSGICSQQVANSNATATVQCTPAVDRRPSRCALQIRRDTTRPHFEVIGVREQCFAAPSGLPVHKPLPPASRPQNSLDLCADRSIASLVLRRTLPMSLTRPTTDIAGRSGKP